MSTRPIVNLGAIPQSRAKRVVKTQSFPEWSVKRAASPRQVLWGAWRTHHKAPSVGRTTVITGSCDFCGHAIVNGACSHCA